MIVYQQSQAFVEKDGDLEFDFTKLIIRGENQNYFYATTKERLGASSTVDLEDLQLIAIPNENIWPYFSDQFLRAPEPLPPNCYIKEPSLLEYGDTPVSLQISAQTLQEVKVCELLRKHPHPNVARYLGCVVEEGRIKGLCFMQYKMTLAKRLRIAAPFDRKLCLAGIEKGIQHLHSIGIVHNDINPSNIMVDELDHPVLIDFDSCRRKGQKLGLKAGTWGWSIEGSEYAQFQNDLYSLSKLQEFMY